MTYYVQVLKRTYCVILALLMSDSGSESLRLPVTGSEFDWESRSLPVALALALALALARHWHCIRKARMT